MRKALSNNLVQNGDFSDSTTSIVPWWASPTLATTPSPGSLAINLLQPGQNYWDAIVGQNGIPLATGSLYSISFGISADNPTRIKLSLQQPNPPYTSYFSQEYDVNSAGLNVTVPPFSVPQADPNASIQFQVGGHAQTKLTLKTVTMQQVGTIPPGQVEEFCGDYTRLQVGPYVYVNNVWGNYKLQQGETYHQCLRRQTVNGQQQMGWVYTWPDRVDKTVYAYPEIVFGAKPWGDPPTTTLLPRQLNQLQTAALTYDITQNVQRGVYDFAPEIWITSSGTDIRSGTITAEIMFWLDYNGATPAGSQVAQATIGGQKYDLFTAQLTSTNPPATWTYLAYRAQQKGAMKGTLPILDFIRDAINRGYVNGNHFLASIEFGTEVSSGAGEVWVNGYKVDVS